MSYKREIPRLNRDNFSAWQELMKLHLSSISDVGLFYLENKYVPPPKPMIVEHMKEAKDHNIMMIDIASSLNYYEFDEVKEYPTTFEIWEKLQKVYRGEDRKLKKKI